MKNPETLKKLNDDELVRNFSDILIEEQERIVLQLEYLAELDRRKLYFSHSSLWAYVVHEHSMEESTAERRIRASRLLPRFPWIKKKLESGELNLSLMEIAQAIASMYPQSIEAPPGAYDQIRPLTDELSEIRFVASHEFVEQLEEIRGLLAHSHPGASLGELFNVMMIEYREKHHPEERAKRAEKRKQRNVQTKSGKQTESAPEDHTLVNCSPSTLKVPSRPLVHKLVLWNGYRCSYRDQSTGRLCESKYALQIDHIHSWARGGKTELKNLRFLCANHHRRVSFLEFGENSRFFRPKSNPG